VRAGRAEGAKLRHFLTATCAIGSGLALAAVPAARSSRYLARGSAVHAEAERAADEANRMIDDLDQFIDRRDSETPPSCG
jgi:hypothetical protein